MPPILESGLHVRLPADSSFRFADCATYGRIKGQAVKEMDFAWVESGKLFLLEVKSFAQVVEVLSGDDFVPVKGKPEPRRFRELVDKLTDSVSMMLGVWAGTAWGQELGKELPAAVRSRMPLKLVVAIDLPPALAVHLQGLRDGLNARLQGRMAIVDVRSVTVIDYARLIAHPVFNGIVTRAP